MQPVVFNLVNFHLYVIYFYFQLLSYDRVHVKHLVHTTFDIWIKYSQLTP